MGSVMSDVLYEVTFFFVMMPIADLRIKTKSRIKNYFIK